MLTWNGLIEWFVIDFYRDAYTGEVDTAAGFALVASSDKCFVWNYSQVRSFTTT